MASKFQSARKTPAYLIGPSATKDPVSGSVDATSSPQIAILENVQSKAVSTLPARSEYVPLTNPYSAAQRAAQERAAVEQQQRDSKVQRSQQQASRDSGQPPLNFRLKTPQRSQMRYVPPNTPTIPQVTLQPEGQPIPRTEPKKKPNSQSLPSKTPQTLPDGPPLVGPDPLPSTPETYFPWWWLVVAAVTTHILFKKGK